MESQTKLWIFIEWSATVTLMLGVALTSWNIYPANLYMSVLGNFLWFLMALHWKKLSLTIIQSVILLIYTVGLFKAIFGF
jgi:hypothetical protein